MKKVSQRFLHYVSFDTTSEENSSSYPSTAHQLVLANELEKELRELGLSDVKQDQYGYVTGTLPASLGCEKAPKIGLFAHMDTSPAVSGANIKATVVKYNGGDILLNAKENIVLSAAEFPNLATYIGHDLIVTDGTTLLGADDKAGIAEIMNVLEYFIAHPEEKHGAIKVAFTPDEEVGNGVKYFDVKSFDADFGYTIDGALLGEINYENFSAASAVFTVHGKSIHPGTAKNKMVNACLLAMEINAMLPPFDVPAHTDLYEGFYHLGEMSGHVEHAVLKYAIRDHRSTSYAQRKQFMQQVADFMNTKYGKGTVDLEVTDLYQNMADCLQDHMHIIESAKAAMVANGVAPIVDPIRGGTDGARLSYQGLPCPNLCTGGQNFHGRLEYISIQAMEKVVDIIVTILKGYASK